MTYLGILGSGLTRHVFGLCRNIADVISSTRMEEEAISCMTDVMRDVTSQLMEADSVISPRARTPEGRLLGPCDRCSRAGWEGRGGSWPRPP